MLRRPLVAAGLRHLVGAGMLAMLAARADAQRPLTLTLAGGATFPSGKLGDAAGTGWHALAGLRLSTPMQPLGLRLDVAHNRFGGDTPAPDQAITSGTLNVTYRIPMTNSPMSPYIIAGAGAYRLECIGEADCGSDTRFGWNAGLGTRLVAFGLRWFIESRFHAAGEARFVPLTLGLTL
jgi:opacity protein-like surface antigen